MKRLIVAAALVALSTASFAANYVKPHARKDGTYVQGHYRSSPNSTRLDNYSTQGNYNPYNGKVGTEPLYKPLRLK